MRANDLKEQVREFWADALGAGVCVEDDTDYFEAGGYSFTATMIIARLNAAYQVKLPLRTLFDNPRFADFVAAAQRVLTEAAEGRSGR